MKVLHCELQYRVGGIESFLVNLSYACQQEDIAFDFLMNGDNEYIEKTLFHQNRTIYKLGNSNKFIRNIKALRLIRRNGYDIVHFHKNSAADIVLPILVKIFTKAKIIIHSHNTQPSTTSKAKVILHYIGKPVITCLSDERLACSELASSWMFINLKSKPVYIINNGILLSKFSYNPEKRAKVRNTLHLNDKIVLGNVGALRTQKNQKYIIDILSKLEENFYAIIIGEGPLSEDLQIYAREKNVENRCMFSGAVSNVNDYLQCMDIFLMPSFWEGLPVSSIEAQAAGLPVILSDKISSMAMLTKYVYFLPLSDTAVWVEKIHEISRFYKRIDMTSAIEEKGFSMEKTAKEIISIYKNG